MEPGPQGAPAIILSHFLIAFKTALQTYSYLALDSAGLHRLAYREWGDPDNPHVVVCVHGLTRNSRDFDFLARNLSRDCRVVCLDVAGRGESDWLEKKEDYGYPLYVADAMALLARVTAPVFPGGLAGLVRRMLGAGKTPVVDWVGTSMGGLIGMMIAAREKSPIRRLVLNDVGPLIPKTALARIGEYVGRDFRFDSLESFEAHLREIHAPFGPLTPAQWRHLALHSHRRFGDGSIGFHYDPAIGLPFQSLLVNDVDLWPLWDRVTCPTLVLRGADSDLVSHETVRAMQARGPGAKVIEFPGVGHAPALMSEDQISLVREFLLG
jgi:pimeloyl-ACP methyl ester carboxylesterase